LPASGSFTFDFSSAVAETGVAAGAVWAACACWFSLSMSA
jgi:hypothetical protein